MSELLRPFTQFLKELGINPLVFAVIGMVIIIFFARNNYRNWKDQSKNQKQILILYLASLIVMIFLLFI